MSSKRSHKSGGSEKARKQPGFLNVESSSGRVPNLFKSPRDNARKSSTSIKEDGPVNRMQQLPPEGQQNVAKDAVKIKSKTYSSPRGAYGGGGKPKSPRKPRGSVYGTLTLHPAKTKERKTDEKGKSMNRHSNQSEKRHHMTVMEGNKDKLALFQVTDDSDLDNKGKEKVTNQEEALHKTGSEDSTSCERSISTLDSGQGQSMNLVTSASATSVQTENSQVLLLEHKYEKFCCSCLIFSSV